MQNMSPNMRNQRLGAKTVSRSHLLISLTGFERLVLFLSYLHFLATVTATLLFVELVISDSLLPRGTDFLSRALLPIGLLGVINIPFLFWIRKSGIRRFHFLEHEAHLDATHFLPASPRVPSASADIYGEMYALVHAIDAADVWDRQAARNEAKTWVVTNRSRLDREAWDYLRENIGYLLPDELTSLHAA
jgi:hypothetical protein